MQRRRGEEGEREREEGERGKEGAMCDFVHAEDVS